MTPEQIWNLYKLTHQDYTESLMSDEEYEHLLSTFTKPKKQIKKPIKVSAVINFNNVYHDAILAANKAGDEWIMKHVQGITPSVDLLSQIYGKRLDVDGSAYLQFWDRRTKVSKWATKISNNNSVHFDIPHKYSIRKDWGLINACVVAAFEVFKNAGVKGVTLKTYYD